MRLALALPGTSLYDLKTKFTWQELLTIADELRKAHNN